ncbi:methylated-DNA--[protein]-cysteine S-methyltransferase [Bowmanella pacifica]|uniref:Methylated-DNA--protein-cysteine methyltransferase n=1 Tax=Bowmanella pacifica TaxID=502051 RepID=A0A917YTW0_9ALTE|nr:methylated-DNA--[protein]-cysteine S-methyltransferase [Bowmanella pacifica]GGO66424.1 methylated-DNA--protein-cysteine methyltransferase [Bowmanella pacifica]
MNVQYCYLQSPIGLVEISAVTQGIRAIKFVEKRGFEAQQTPLLNLATEQLAGYFDGQRQVFDLPLAAQGTSFQQQVWNALLSIPFGQTASYLDIARKIGNPAAVRAVGAANGKNPLSVVVPCHRIIGSNGTLTGYAGGLERKAWLLQHEQLQPSLGDW